MKIETAIFGGGCFWCTEAAFNSLKGVIEVIPGYTGGDLENPTYEKVSSGISGHAEVVKVLFDPNIISFTDLLNVFFTIHDPTTLNRQGNDIGTQYRSIILYRSEEQKEESKKIIKMLTSEKVFDLPIVTEIKPFLKFYKAEDYHVDYYQKNKTAPYCQLIINPKLDKLRKRLDRLLK